MTEWHRWRKRVGAAIGCEIRARRIQLGLSQAHVAFRLYGLRQHRPLVTRTEKGYHLPTLEQLFSYADILCCDVRDLVRPIDEIGPPPDMA